MVIAQELKVRITTIVSRKASSNGKVLVTGKLENNQFVSMWIPAEANVKVDDVVTAHNVSAIVASLRFNAIDAVISFIKIALALVATGLDKLNAALDDKSAEAPFKNLFWLQQVVYCEYIHVNDSDEEFVCAGASMQATNSQLDEIKRLQALLNGTPAAPTETVKDAGAPTTTVQKPRLGNKKQVTAPAQG